MTEDKKPCFCRRYIIEVANAELVLNGIPICNRECLKKAEEQTLKWVAEAAGRIS